MTTRFPSVGGRWDLGIRVKLIEPWAALVSGDHDTLETFHVPARFPLLPGHAKIST
jgi:hypothetical protein